MVISGRSGRILPELIAVAALLTMFVALASSWSSLPERVPRHFGITGKPDAWGGTATLYALPAIGVVLYILLTVVRAIPGSANLPGIDRKTMTPAQSALAIEMLGWLKAQMAVLFAYLEIMTIRIARGNAEGLHVYVMLLWIILMMGTAGWYTMRARRLQ